MELGPSRIERSLALRFFNVLRFVDDIDGVEVMLDDRVIPKPSATASSEVSGSGAGDEGDGDGNGDSPDADTAWRCFSPNERLIRASRFGMRGRPTSSSNIRR